MFPCELNDSKVGVSLQTYDLKKLEPSNMVPYCTIGGTIRSSKTSGKMTDNKTTLKKSCVLHSIVLK